MLSKKGTFLLGTIVLFSIAGLVVLYIRKGQGKLVISHDVKVRKKEVEKMERKDLEELVLQYEQKIRTSIGEEKPAEIPELGRLRLKYAPECDHDVFSPRESSVLVRTRKGPKYYISSHPKSYQVSYVNKDGIYVDTEIVQNVLESLNAETDFVLDVGANCGHISFVSGLEGFRVLSLEVLPKNVKYFKRGLILNNLADKVKLLHMGVGEKAEDFVGATVRGHYLFSEVNGMLFKSEDEAQEFAEKQKKTIDTYPVSVRPLDWILDRCLDSHVLGLNDLARIRFFKIDVEGFEVAAFKGGRRFLELAKPLIFCEVNRMQIERAGSTIEELADSIFPLGYKAYTILKLQSEKVGKEVTKEEFLKIKFLNVLFVHDKDRDLGAEIFKKFK